MFERGHQIGREDLGTAPLAGRDQVQRTAFCRHRKIPPLPSRSERATNLRSI
jgi:hypothetical protein